MGNDCQNTHQKHGVEQSSSFLFVLLERYCMLGWRWFDSKRPQDLPCYRHHKEELCHCWNNNTDCITRLFIDRPVINAMNYSQIICKKHDTKVPYGKASHNQVYSKTREKLVRAKGKNTWWVELSPTTWWFALPTFGLLPPVRTRENRSGRFLALLFWACNLACICCLPMPVPWKDRWWDGIHSPMTKLTSRRCLRTDPR